MAARDAQPARWWPLLWSAVLALLLLGPALGPGYVVRYDMVWVPDLALRPDFLGLGSGLPRAVPSDALVAVLDLVLPSMLLQKLMLLGTLVAAGTGAARLVPLRWTAGRAVAVTIAIWNPFVVERLLIGHWPVLVGYAALPWVVVAARSWRRSGRLPAALPLLLVAGSLSAGAGVVTGTVLLALVAGRAVARRSLLAVALVLAANAPWLVSGLLHATQARTDPAGAAAFGLGDAGSLPGPVAALALGGIWNLEVVPASQEGLLGWAFVALVVVLAALGWRGWWRGAERREAVGLVGLWIAGYALAVLTWGADGVVAALVEAVPGGGLLRDGSRLLALCLPLTVVLTGHGAHAVVRALAAQPVPRLTAATVLAVLPVTLLPDAALGAGGRLEPVDYPASYADARRVLVADTGSGDVLVLPLSAYRRPSWAQGTKMLDPSGRYLPRDYVASDELVVSGRPIAGEDPRVAALAGALAAGTPEERAAALAGEGIAWVVTTAAGAPAVAGEVRVDSPELRLVRLEPEVGGRGESPAWLVAMALAWAAFLGLVLVAAARAAVGAREATKRRSREVSAE